MATVVGIDLGTTNSLIGWMEGERPRIVADSITQKKMLASAVSFLDDKTPVVGDAARRRAELHPQASILSVKRLMGIGLEHLDEIDRRTTRVVDAPGPLRITLNAGTHELRLTPPEVSALILRELKRRAEIEIGGTVERAVITVPAYFDDSQRQATRDAGRLAGLEVLRLVNEPTAAALAYGLDQRQEACIAVFDLGGGTFDISILRMREGLSEVLATGGDTRLGGDDFDRELVSLLSERATPSPAEEADPRTFALLLAAAERAKRQLSESSETHLEIPLPEGTRVVSVSRAEFEVRTRHLIERTIDRCRRTLLDSGRTATEIDEVILVGGASRMPAVRTNVAAFFGRQPLCDIDPDLVVALGATVQAGILSGSNRDMLLLDVVPLSLGIETMGGVFSRLIDRNTTIPAAARQEYTTAVDNQTHVEIHVLQGEREIAKDCRSLAHFRIGIAPQPAGLPRVEVTFLIDANGILSVAARDQRTDTEQSIEVKPSYGLTDEAIETMLEESFDLAEEDFALRQLIEARVEAESVLHTLERSLLGHSRLLIDDENARIVASATTLREACGRDDHNLIRDLLDALNETSSPFAQRIMEASLRRALESRSIDELEGR